MAADTETNGARTLLYTEAEAADLLRLSVKALYNIRTRGELAYIREGRAIRYDLASLKDWIDRRKRSDG